MPQLDTRGINARIGTMQGINAVGQQQRTKNLQSRNLLMQEQIGQLPEQREREGMLWERGTEEYEQKKKESDLNYKELIKGIKDKDRKRLIEQKKDIAVRLLRVNPGDISTWQKEWDMLTAENPEMVKGLESMGLSRDQITPETHEDLKDIVLGELKVLTDHQAEEKSKLEAQKIKGRSDLQAQADRAAGKRAKVTGPGKGTKKESPILKDLRDRYQQVKSERRRLKSGVNIIPGMPEEEKKAAIADSEKELELVASAYEKNGGNLEDLGKSKASKTEVEKPNWRQYQ